MRYLAFILSICFSFVVQAAQIEVLDSANYDKALKIIDISNKDIKNYALVFEYIQKKDWKNVDKITPKIKNQLLMNLVLSYRNKPVVQPSSQQKIINSKEILSFRRALKAGKTKRARQIIEEANFVKTTPKASYDELMTTLAFSYFLDNMDSMAFKYSSKVANTSKSVTAHWIAGLSAYRLKQYQNAAKYFDKLSILSGDEWVVSAGGYWGNLAYKKLHKPQKAQELLKRASAYSRTFYGIMAIEALGLANNYNWECVSYLNDYNKPDFLNEMLKSDAIKRAIILLKINQNDLAAREIKRNIGNLNNNQLEAMMFVFNQFKIYHMAIFLSNHIKDNQKNYYYDEISYPEPSLSPKKGWHVDKALVFALMRQESSFHSQAKSPAGACGLMQLMPNTAFHISKDAKYKKNSEALLDEGLNIYLGQMYVEYLLQKPFIQNNLFFMMTAYNAGPGNFLKWQKKQKYDDNPLMYIETIPARETRLYIKRVMTNYWIYNERMNQNHQTLENLVKGKWPVI